MLMRTDEKHTSHHVLICPVYFVIDADRQGLGHGVGTWVAGLRGGGAASHQKRY